MEVSNTVDNVETAANITVSLTIDGAKTFEIPVSELDRTKEVDVERVREVGLYPDGYAINGIDIDGTITFSGDEVRVPGKNAKFNLDDLLFDDDGTPTTFDVTVYHQESELVDDSGSNSDYSEMIENCIVTSAQYNASAGETTESTYEFIGQRIS
jgi:hypothetical protein